MDSASIQFITFGLVVAIFSNLKRSSRWRSAVLLVASFIFIGLLAQDLTSLLPLAGFLLLGYIGLTFLERNWFKSTVWISTVVIVYLWLKKYTFFPERVLIHAPYFTLGLSYIFFRVLQLLIEAGAQNEKPRTRLGGYLLYTLNFTTLITGPIQSYDAFAQDQFASKPMSLGIRLVGLQLERIVRGFFKVNVLALLFDMVRVDALGQLSQQLPLDLRIFAGFKLAVAYPFFLYANFSGYIDIVTALARLMRVHIPENFDRPFSASSVLDFWNRWHITLSTWLKSYVYNPLLIALMRRFPSSSLQPVIGVLCFFVTFFLVGVWHGRTSEFIFFGLLTGAGISINKLWQLGWAHVMGRKRYKTLASSPVYEAMGRGLTYSWFAFTLLWFWADWDQIHKIFSGLDTTHWLIVWVAVWLCATLSLETWERLRPTLLAIKTFEGQPLLFNRYALVVCASVLGLIALVMNVMLNQPAPAVVYKAF